MPDLIVVGFDTQDAADDALLNAKIPCPLLVRSRLRSPNGLCGKTWT
ncbi:hypothetical protein [Bosea vaviloviae]|nr:hypothetical protein [Bosea vaviloviae]